MKSITVTLTEPPIAPVTFAIADLNSIKLNVVGSLIVSATVIKLFTVCIRVVVTVVVSLMVRLGTQETKSIAYTL